MKTITSIILLLLATSIAFGKSRNDSNPLSVYSSEWNQPKYNACNTAARTKYLSETEKEIIYILNMARMNPKLFCKTVVSKAYSISSFVDTNSEFFYKSLVKEMSAMEPLNILEPDSLCFISANCHALTAGKKGYVGHDRQSADCRKKQHFFGECCQFGIPDALGVIINLLVDQDVESLGHRHICLGANKKISPAMAPHKTYGTMTVIDFY